MPTENKKALLIGLSGISSSGKTTLARLLRDIFPRTFILHLDDFYKTDAEIPITSTGIQDWDCLESIDLLSFKQTLEYIHQHGEPPRSLTSKEDKNSVGEVAVDKILLEDLKWKASKWMFADAPPMAIIDGFLLFSEEMEEIRDLFDVKLFLRAEYNVMKTRREARSGYVTLEGFWEDPPGYVDAVVWPNYVKDHAFLFKDGDVEGEIDGEVLGRLGIEAMPDHARGDMTACLQWAYDVLDDALHAFTSRSC
ncbi:related to M.pneumoniae uridine kinase udk [Ramularia collo-cygni]|uniref:Related to M.pneumoniae uridine kinase udk n=1 Tax=Ramularia collo-cygni TaxID=112498 RepID=A0A2D3VGL0_9PEZI|nr:related to M.pneumoniae uridine kinase udk [Ramularia collo-cygni]CZT24382.1 related to M.pneumoniae uridine kinase udk [Ramularia collo-cygni]